MVDDTTPHVAPVSRRRRALFIALTALVVAGAIEAASAVAWWLSGSSSPAVGVGLELGADAADGEEKSGGPVFDPRQGVVLHPFLGFVLDAETAPRLGNSEVARRLGFPFNLHKPIRGPSDDALVVALFGGSFAEQTYIFAYAELTEALASIERFAGRKIILINLASGGYKQPQQLQALHYLLALGGHIDVAINLDGFNETALIRDENISLGTHPSFPRSWRLRVDDLGPETRRAMAEIAWLEDRRRRSRTWASEAPWRWSFTVRLVHSRIHCMIVDAIARREALIRDAESGEASFQAAGPKFHYADWDQAFDAAAALWRRSSLLMHRTLMASGGEYHHFLQPNQYVEGSKPLSPEELRDAYVGDSGFRRDIGRGYPRLVAAGESLRADEGVAFHSLLRVFADRQETLYVDNCCHVNRAGYRIIAEAIARHVENRDSGSPSPER
ncbi:MAG: hypothetical protein AAGM22_32535 [Acidobacteriota bacterium]